MLSFRVGILLVLYCVASTLSGMGQALDRKREVRLLDELIPLYKISELPFYCEHSPVLQVSSYDTTGGNEDGFKGTYSFVRRNEDSSLVIFDVKGCGVIQRIWTPTPSEDTIDFFFDNSPNPSFSIKYSELFSGKVFPFVAPLVGAKLGGYYCYFPILFQHGCKILYRGKRMQFYQVQYRKLREGTVSKNFTSHLDPEEMKALEHIVSLWNRDKVKLNDLLDGDAIKKVHSNTAISLLPGDRKTIFTLKKGGRILSLKLWPAAAFAGSNKDIDIKITWDGATVPAIYCPVADFFGYAFGHPSMNSLLLGTKDDKNYCYFPMPFDKAARVELIYRKNSNKQPLVRCASELIYSNVPRNKEKEGKFYAGWRANYLPEGTPPHVILKADGKGHYVGTLLQAQGLRPGMTSFFEGDDSTAVDGIPCIHGTGSEDYFNGGWYACPDRWDTRASLPIHGALDYSLPLCRTGGYRLYLSDKIPFEKNIFQSIEHGGDARGVPVDYTSVSFYYCDKEAAHIQMPTNERCQVYMPDTLMLYPQLMQYTVWGSVNMYAKGTKFNTGGSSCIYTTDDKSRLRISLSPIPFDIYQLFADVVKVPGGSRFSVWQEQTKKSDWIDTYSADTNRIQSMYVCDVQVNEFQNALTFTFKTNKERNCLFLNRLILVRKKD